MKLYFVRHGETDWNRRGKIQGQADIPLNSRGRMEAERTAEYLKKIPFDAAFTSPLIRARDTGKIILKNRECPVREAELLKEISYGVKEGQWLWMIHHWPVCRLHAYFHHPERFVPPRKGESIAELKSRCRKFLYDVALPLEHEKKHILVTTHGAWIRGMISEVEQLPDEQFWEGKNQKNCSVTVIDCTLGKMRLEKEAISASEL